MTTANAPLSAAPAVARRPLQVLPLIGACLALAALLVAIVVGDKGTAAPSIVLAAAGGACLVAALAGRVWQILRAPEGALLAIVGLGAIAALMAAAGLGLTPEGVLALIFGVLGTLLAAYGIKALRVLHGAHATPWGALRGVTLADRAQLLVRSVGPLLVGAILIMAAVQIQYGGEGFMAITLTAAGLIAYELRRTAAAHTPTARTDRTQTEVAAHLHDSVLQTLALIQRSAHDPARVAQLARQQERSLRDWLAGRDGGTPATVPAALHAIAAEVEQEVPGSAIDVICVGTAPMDRRTEMLTQAAREAMRNAARHGSTKVRVFCESDPQGVTVYVRDTGPGLRLDDVPADRRGVRDAIIGRMDHVDGTVSIDSGNHGTEIELRLPARAA